MYTLFILYIAIIFITFLWINFGKSLKRVQYQYHRYLSDTSLFDYKKNHNLYMLGCCVFSGILLNTYETNFFISEYTIIKGLTYTFQEENFGFMCKHPDSNKKNSLIMSISSTSSIDDVLVSIDNELTTLQSKNGDVGKIHKGYLDQIMKILPSVLTYLSKEPFRNTIYLTGHSLGGALVTVLAIILYIYFPKRYKFKIYTFGSPKYADEEAIDFIEKRNEYFEIVNYINDADPVVNKPVDPRYHRVGKDIHWKLDSGNDNVNHGIRTYKECVLEIKQQDSSIKKRIHRFDEIISRGVLDLLSS